MDFHLLNEAKNEILCLFHFLGVKPSAGSTSDILHDYFNLQHKFIVNRPRQIKISNHLMAKARSLGVENAVNTIIKKLEEGKDINPFLSKGILRPGVHDYLLNDWQIHHLHLSITKKKPTDYFIKRSPQLLFIHVIHDYVYLIDIRSHNENYVFAQRELLRIVRDNWKDLNNRFMIKGEPMEIYPKLDEKEIAVLRRKGYMFITEVDGYAYLPGQGSMCSGFSLEAGREMDQFCRDLYKIQSYIEENEDQIKADLSKQCNKIIQTLKFTVKFFDWMFEIHEESSQLTLDFHLNNYLPKLWRKK